MSPRDPQYRGYRITAERKSHYWRLSVHPTQADVPIMSQHTFTVPDATLPSAVAEAKRRIDRLLSEPQEGARPHSLYIWPWLL